MALTRIPSTPAFYISGVLFPVVPNSVMYKHGGERNVRAMSAGGGSIEVVSGIDASKMLSEVHCEIPATNDNINAIEAMFSRANDGQSETVMLVDKGFQRSFDQMVLANEPDFSLKSDGSIKLEFKGRYAA